MGNLLAVICCGVGVFIWWWLAGLMKRHGRGWFARQLTGVFTCLIVAIVLAFTAVTGWVAIEKYVLAQPTSVQREAEKTLGLKPAEYAARINPLLEQLGSPYRVKPDELGKGATHDILSADMGPHATLAARVSRETGELVEVMLIDNGDGKPASDQEIHQLASIALASAMDGVDASYVLNQLPDLLKGGQVTVGGVKLGAKSTGVAGTCGPVP